MPGLQYGGECVSRAFAVGDGVDDFAASVDAIASGEILGVGGLAGGAVNAHAAVLNLDPTAGGQKGEQRRLAYGRDQGIADHAEFGATYPLERAVRRVSDGGALQGLQAGTIGGEMNGDWLSPPAEPD